MPLTIDARKVRIAKAEARTGYDQARFWDGRADLEAATNARARMDAALDQLLELGIGTTTPAR